MPILLLASILIYVFISFAIGFILAYPVPGAICIGIFAIISAIYDFKRGAL
tara:strand:- start:577 stop:729 length:153 start_codon:yes stop_codon:yes gene_type:complete